MEENNTENVTNSSTVPQDNGQSKNQSQIAGAIIIVGVMIAGAILLKGNGVAPTRNAPNPENRAVATDLRPVSANEHILGDINAEIIIVEYSDTECPFCKTFHNTMHSILAKNNGRVAWVFRHYPIPQLHQKALKEAEATECAWEQGGNDAFWKYTDQVFARTQSNDKLDVAELPKIAKDIGLNVTLFNTCLASGKYIEKINADVEDGRMAGAVGTPYSVLLTKKDISAKTQSEIAAVVNTPGRPPAVSFSSTKKNAITLNGALPVSMMDSILSILLK